MDERRKIDREGVAVRDLGTIKRKISMTTYEIALHFSKTSVETAQDKLRRIIINDCVNEKQTSD